MRTLEQDGIPDYMAHPEGPGQRPGVVMAHHAHGVTADYKIDAFRLAQLGFIVLVPSLFNMFGVPGTNRIGAGAEVQAKHGDGEGVDNTTPIVSHGPPRPRVVPRGLPVTQGPATRVPRFKLSRSLKIAVL